MVKVNQKSMSETRLKVPLIEGNMHRYPRMNEVHQSTELYVSIRTRWIAYPSGCSSRFQTDRCKLSKYLGFPMLRGPCSADTKIWPSCFRHRNLPLQPSKTLMWHPTRKPLLRRSPSVLDTIKAQALKRRQRKLSDPRDLARHVPRTVCAPLHLGDAPREAEIARSELLAQRRDA